jgi:hypothetical protein|tara:strand:- start:814 stop:1065 length:252 start_codon:yes stop_codon:yes gene_type:complete
MASKKLSDNELQSLNKFQERNNTIIVQLGTIEVRIDALEEQKEELLENFRKLTVEQQEFGVKLQEKYGDGNINLEKGEFTSAE